MYRDTLLISCLICLISAPNAQGRAEEAVADASEPALGGPPLGLGHVDSEVPVSAVAPVTVLQLNEARPLQCAMEENLRPARPSTGGKEFSVSVPPCCTLRLTITHTEARLVVSATVQALAATLDLKSTLCSQPAVSDVFVPVHASSVRDCAIVVRCRHGLPAQQRNPAEARVK